MKKLMLLVASVGLLFVGLFPLAAQASGTFTWSNARTIIGPDGTSYVWNGTQGTYIYASTKLPSPSCLMGGQTIPTQYVPYKGAALIDITDNFIGTKTFTLYTYKNAGSGYCKQTSSAITVPDNITIEGIVYLWVNKNTIQAYDSSLGGGSTDNWHDSQTYTSTDGINFTAGDKTCPSRLVTTDHRFAHVTQSSTSGNIGDTKPVNGCTVQKYGANFTLGNVQNASIAPATPPADTAANAAIADDACATATGVYSWMLCPALQLADKFLKSAYDNWIQPFLAISPLTNEPDLIAVWKLFVQLADIFFVIAFLVLIFGTSLNLNAYTIKKALPRLVIAVIAVQFSYFICGFIVDIGNVLGMGIEGLVQAALSSTPHAVVATRDVTHPLAKGLISTATVVFAGAAAIWVLGVGLVLILLSLVLSIFSFIFTLVVRKLLIDILILLSPIAIVAWVLPNTEKLFKQWSTNFVKAVMIYPIVSLLIVGGYILQSAFSGSGQAAQLMAVLAPMIAFFMMPMAFKWGGQAMGLAGKIGAKSGLAGMADKSMAAGIKPGKDLMANTTRNLKAASAARRDEKAAGTGFGARRAQIQAGYGFGITDRGKALRDKQVQLARDKSEKEEQTAFTHKAENTTAEANGVKLGEAGTSLNQGKAIASQLYATGQHGEIAKARSSFIKDKAAKYKAANLAAGKTEPDAEKAANSQAQSDWGKVLGKNYSPLMEKSPHAVLGMGGEQGAAITMSAPLLQSSNAPTRKALAHHIFGGKDSETPNVVNQGAFDRLAANLGQSRQSETVRASWNAASAQEFYVEAARAAHAEGHTEQDAENFRILGNHMSADGTLMQP